MKQFETIDAIYKLLQSLGVDITDENFKDTPKRVMRSYSEILQGQDDEGRNEQLKEIISKAFPTTYRGIVAQKGIKTVGMCPHHMLPIKYSIDIGYIAKNKALGLSKLVRVAKLLSARMVLQETLTKDIADIFTKLGASGVIVIVRGEHGCMSYRGVMQDVQTTTSSVTGIFDKDVAARQEFLSLSS